MKLSKWQKGKPPRDGIWEIKTPNGEHWYARSKGGLWDGGYHDLKRVPKSFKPYEDNNDPKNPVKWRGIIE